MNYPKYFHDVVLGVLLAVYALEEDPRVGGEEEVIVPDHGIGWADMDIEAVALQVIIHVGA